MKILNKPYTTKQYAEFAMCANNQNMEIIDTGDFLELKSIDIIDQTYLEKRINEYPDMSEQLDMIYWDKINGTNIWLDKITGIKNKYPKE